MFYYHTTLAKGTGQEMMEIDTDILSVCDF